MITYNLMVEDQSLNSTIFYDNTTIQHEYLTQLNAIYDFLNADSAKYSIYLSINARTSNVPGQLLAAFAETSEIGEICTSSAVCAPGNTTLNLSSLEYQSFASLNSELGFSSADCSTLFSETVYCVFNFENVWLNLDYAVSLYQNSLGDEMGYLDKNLYMGDGDEVTASVEQFDSANGGFLWSLTFIDKWGDCPAGCIYSNQYELTVEYYNGSVTYVTMDSSASVHTSSLLMSMVTAMATAWILCCSTSVSLYLR
mmetsp:Transcript_38513/g.56611  ORF Transcript_38513/g.56611 Transcript_38513/m.56611 type:complete len:255 (+) Transcript_38513:124-888(+)